MAEQTATTDKPTKSLKCVIVGDGAVGKTCLLITHAQGKFPSDYVPTVFDNYNSIITKDDMKVCLLLIDTAGQEDYDRLRPMSYPDTHVFIVCYSVDNINSFHNVSTKWVPEIHEHCPEVPFILVALKVDMRDSPEKSNDNEEEDNGEESDEDNAKRLDSHSNPNQPLTPDKMIKKEDGEKLAQEVGAAYFIECSAFTLQNLENVFLRAIDSALQAEETKRITQQQNNRTPKESSEKKAGCCLLQ